MLKTLNPNTPPTLQALQNYEVNRANQWEVIWQPLYEYKTYAAAGTTSPIVFFQNTVGSVANSYAGTNVEAAGQMPSPKRMLVTGIQVVFIPGNPVGENNVAVANNFNDVESVLNGDAWLEFFIGSKTYLRDSPLSKFTQQFRLDGVGALTGESAATTPAIINYATHCGRYYSITPVVLPSNQNFNVSLNFPSALATNVDAKIGVILDGFQYRLSQ